MVLSEKPRKNKLFLQIALIIGITFTLLAPVQAATITVCPSGCEYASIQATISNANPKDVIEVHSGTYYENVIIDKPITLRGVDTGRGRPIVDGNGVGSVITITADGVKLEGFVVKNPGGWPYAGIMVTSNKNVIKNNIILDSDNIGIKLYYSTGNTIFDNTFLNNDLGIRALYSNNNIINNNAFSRNLLGC